MRNFLLNFILVCISSQYVLADKIVLLDTNEKSMQTRADLIENAKESIRAQYFSIENDALEHTALAMLKNAAFNGIKVQVIVDSMHNNMRLETMAAATNLPPERKGNLEIREYNTFNLLKPFTYTKRMHDKALIIDERYLISGGRNVGNGYYGFSDKDSDGNALPVFEDSDVLSYESSAVQSAVTYFDDLWNSRFVKEVNLYNFSDENLSISCLSEVNRLSCEQDFKKRLQDIKTEEQSMTSLLNTFKTTITSKFDWKNESIQIKKITYLHDDVKTQNSSLKKPKSNIGSKLYEEIAKATESIIITTPYLIITPEQMALFKSLREKTPQVKISIITNSKGANDVPAAHLGYEKTRKQALNIGVKIYEYQGPDTLHAKMVLIDRSIVFIGSYNWDPRSQNLNREVGILAELPDEQKNNLTHEVVRKFAKILKKSCKVDPQGEVKPELCKPDRSVHSMTPEEFSNLNDAFNIRQKDPLHFWKLIFPLIKGQL